MELNTNLGRYILNPFKVLATTNISTTVAPASIDSQALTAGDRIFLSGQSTATQNGGWIFASAGAPLTRSTDLPVGATIKSGTVFMCNAGTVYGDKLIVIFASSDAPIIIGTTTFSISTVGDSYTFSTGLTDTSGVITSDIITGKSGGQTAAGGTGPSENLIITSTLDGTKGFVTIGSTFFDEAGGYVGFGTASPGAKIEIVGDGSTSATYSLDIYDSSANSNFYVRDDGAVNSRKGYWFNGVKIAFLGATSNSNTFVGDASGNLTQTGLYNSCFGQGTGFELSTGYQNAFLGMQAGRFVTTGFNNTLVGFQSGYSMVDGDNCVGVGSSSITDNVGGNRVIGIGCSSGNDSATGNDLIFIGDNTGVSADGWDDSVAIGTLAIITANNQFVVGSPTHRINDYYFGAGFSESSATGAISISPSGITAGNSNISAATNAFNIGGAVGTGTGVGGDINFKVAPAGGSGTSRNALVTKMTIKGTGIINQVLPTGNAGLSSGDLYKDTAANVLANGDYVVGMKA